MTIRLVSLQEFKTSRKMIRTALHEKVASALSTVHVEVPDYLFFITDVKLPSQIQQKDLDAAVQFQDNVREQHKQVADLVRKETERLEQTVYANVTLVRDSAAAQSARINLDARSVAEKEVATADNRGLFDLFETIGVNDAATKRRYIEYFALRSAVEEQLTSSQSAESAA